MPHSLPLAVLTLVACAATAAAQRPQFPPTLPPFPAVPESVMPAERPEREGGEGGEAERDEIETDRDSFTPALTTVRRGRIVFESAYTFVDNRGLKETHSFPEALVRYGLTEWLELRLGFNYEVGGASNETSGDGSGGEEDFFAPGKVERESSVSYGAKFQLTRQRGWLPASALILQGTTPTSGPANETHLTAASVVGWDFAEVWEFDAGLRYRSANLEEDRFGLWAPSVVLKRSFRERIEAHVEYFGLFSRDREADIVRHFISPGVHYLFTDDFEVGLRLGWGLNDQSSRYFVNAGVGVRF